MSLFDSFSGGSASLINSATAAMRGAYPTQGNIGNNNPSAEGVSGSKYYKVYITARTDTAGEISIVADGPSEFSFETSVEYGTPYQDIASDAIGAIPGNIGKAAELAQKAAEASGTKLFTQALTAKVWTGGGSTVLSVPLIFQAEDDPEKDVLMPLMKLMYLSMPKEKVVGGFLASPGPSFDLFNDSGSGTNPAGAADQSKNANGSAPVASSNTTKGKMINTDKGPVSSAVGYVTDGINAGAAQVSENIKKRVRNPISVKIGESFKLDNVVIKSVSQKHRLAPIGLAPGVSSGINSLVVVEVQFESFYTLTQRDISSMLMPMTSDYATSTLELYQRMVGAENA